MGAVLHELLRLLPELGLPAAAMETVAATLTRGEDSRRQALRRERRLALLRATDPEAARAILDYKDSIDELGVGS